MAVKNRIADFLFYAVMGTLYSFALSWGFVTATVLEVPPLRMLGLCALCILVLYGALYNSKTSLVFLGAVLLSMGGVYLFLRGEGGGESQLGIFVERLTQLRAFFAAGTGPTAGPAQEWMAPMLSAVVCGVMALLTAVNLRLWFSLLSLALLGATVFTVPILMDYGLAQPALILFLFCLVVFVCKRMNEFSPWKMGQQKGIQPDYSLIAVALGLVIAATAYALPKPETVDIDPHNVGEQLRQATDNLTYRITPATRKPQSYTEDGGKLGGPITLGDELVMTVEAPERVYLRGSVRDSYTGTAWKASRDKWDSLSPQDSSYDSTEYTPAVRTRQEYYMRYYDWREQTVSITMVLPSKTVFTPPFRSSLTLAEDNKLRQNSYGSLQVGGALGAGDSYRQGYIGWNYRSQYFAYVLQNLEPHEPEMDLAPYLAVPDSLPQRVTELAEELTRDKHTDYDRLKALEAYLASTFPYTLEPDSVPAGEDFVDYFLFTGKEGYCVYYASAMAVMGRTLDIPTRYVEGFVLPTQPEGGVYQVTNAQAHAWVEGYFPGFGWVPFEPTGGVYSERYGHDPDDTQEIPQDDPELPEEQDPVDLETPEPPDPPAPEDQTPPEESTPDQEGDTSAETGGKPPWLVVVLSAALLLALSGVFVQTLRSLYRSRWEKMAAMPNREAAAAYYGCVVHGLGVYGCPILPGETASHYANRAAEKLAAEGKSLPIDESSLEDLTDIFIRATYSQEEISDGERQRMEGYYRQVLALLRGSRQMNRVKYLLGRYLFLRF